jgi:glycine betaine catabolism A
MIDDVEAPTQAGRRVQRGLTGPDYHSPEIFEVERERIFHRKWFCVGREEQAANPGDYFTVDVIDESVVVVRGKDAQLRAFHNVCRHRGTLLCDGAGTLRSVIECPYHAWAYSLDGKLLRTPNVGEYEGLDRSEFGLFPVELQTWDGFVFVRLGDDREPLLDKLARDPDQPLAYARYRMGELRVGHRITYEVDANWKIIIDNYNECLHCPKIHPELCEIVPMFRRGQVVEEREDGWSGAPLAPGARTMAYGGTTSLPVFPGLSDLDQNTYYGFTAFPNLLANLLSDTVMTYLLLPTAPDHTTIVSEYLFRPETISSPDFDPSGVVEFLDLVSRQDWAVCERAQRGIRSRAFDRVVLPWNDRLLAAFADRYLAERDGTT